MEEFNEFDLYKNFIPEEVPNEERIKLLLNISDKISDDITNKFIELYDKHAIIDKFTFTETTFIKFQSLANFIKSVLFNSN